MDGDQDGLTDGAKDGITRKVIPRMEYRRQPEIFNLATIGGPILLMWHTPRSGMGTPGPVRRMADATKRPFSYAGAHPNVLHRYSWQSSSLPHGGGTMGGPQKFGDVRWALAA